MSQLSRVKQRIDQPWSISNKLTPIAPHKYNSPKLAGGNFTAQASPSKKNNLEWIVHVISLDRCNQDEFRIDDFVATLLQLQNGD